jgi:outer membrane lipoprotein-sorting protein
LWIPDGQSNAIQEKVTKDSDDYYLATYSNVKYVHVDDSVFNLKVPPGTAVVTQH